MAKQRRATVSAKLTYSEDSDLISWWESLPRGSRSAIMKDMMRDYIERHNGSFYPVYPRSQPQPFDPRHFAQLVEDAAWTRTAMLDLPGYLERLMAQMAVIQGTQGAANHGVQASLNDVPDDAAARRAERTRRAKW